MIFNEPGTYPGVPGLFASCKVELDEAGKAVESPLVPHPHFEPGPADEPVQAEQEQKTDTPSQNTQQVEQTAPPQAPADTSLGG